MTSPSSDKPNQENGQNHQRRLVPAGQVLIVTLATLVLTVFLDADGLVNTAERQELGWKRSTALAVMHPIQSVSNALYINRPRQWLADATNRNQKSFITSTEDVVVATTTPAEGSGSPSTTTTTTTLPSYRTPTADDPLHIMVVGDSLSTYVGLSIADRLRNRPAKVIPHDEAGTGLARPDVIDWPSRLTEEMERDKPDVVVIMFGGNDAQGLRTADGWVYIEDYDEWKAEYQRRIAQVLDVVTQQDVSVWWIGLPVMVDQGLQKVAPDINQMVQLEVAARAPQAHFVDSNNALAAEDGSYRVFAPNSDGAQVKIRANDGIHPTKAGTDRIVDLFLPELIKLRNLDG